MKNTVKLKLTLWSFLLIASSALSSCDTGISVGDDTPPATIEDLSFDPATRLLSWTAPGDDGNNGRAAIYFIRFFEGREVAEILGLPSLQGVPFTTIEEAVQSNFNDATQIVNPPEPDRAGTPENFSAPRLDIEGRRRFFYAIRSDDEVGNESNPSNVVEVKTPLNSLEFQNSASGGCLGEAVGSDDFNRDDDNDDDEIVDDIVIGDPCLGRVYIFFGGDDLFQGANNGVIDVTSADVTIIGNPGDLFGASVAGVGNFEDDVADELAIGAPGFDGGRGEVFIVVGDRDGLPPVIDFTAGDQPDFLITGENVGDSFGFTVVRRRTREMLVGAPGAESESGKAYLFRLRDIDSVTPASDARAIVVGESAGDMFGFDITEAGEIDDGSQTEFAASSPGAGKVYVFFEDPEGVKDLSVNTSDVVTIVGSSEEGFGLAISGGGDIDEILDEDDDEDEDDDDIDDLLVGAPGTDMDRGSVFLYSGEDIDSAKTSGTSPDFETEFTGVNPGDRFGTSVSLFDDLTPRIDREERDTATILILDNTNSDFGVGAPGTPEGGTVYLFFGRSDFPPSVPADNADILLNGGAPGLEFGRVVTGLGDITGDLIEDFAAAGLDFVRAEF